MKTIMVQKMSEGCWWVHNTKNGKTAEVVKINEYNPLGAGGSKYRVDARGRTVKSMISHYQSAVKVARECVK